MHAQNASNRRPAGPGQRGFTLLELMVVVAVIAVGAAGVALALRDGSQTALEREADRLGAILDAARAQSRASGVALHFRPVPGGFVIAGQGPSKPQTWLSQGVQVQSTSSVELGPEPIIPASRIVLSLGQQTRVLATDGLLPFRSRGDLASGS